MDQHRVAPVGTAALIAAGVLFAGYQATRPYSSETGLDGAVAMASPAWQFSHLMGMAAFALLLLAQVMVAVSITGTPARRAAVVAACGAGLCTFGLLPYYGGETFGLAAVAAESLTRDDLTLLSLADAIRMAPVPATLFGLGSIGMLLCAVSSLVALARSGRSRVLGWPFVIAAALFVPQFFGPAPVRIGYGVLLGAGLVASALGMTRVSRHPDPAGRHFDHSGARAER